MAKPHIKAYPFFVNCRARALPPLVHSVSLKKHDAGKGIMVQWIRPILYISKNSGANENPNEMIIGGNPNTILILHLDIISSDKFHLTISQYRRAKAVYAVTKYMKCHVTKKPCILQVT